MDKSIGQETRDLLDSALEMETNWCAAVKSEVGVLPMPWESLNDALGIGGLPKGHVVEVTGRYHVGKSVFTWQAATQCGWGSVAIADTDRGLNLTYMKNVGLDPDSVAILRSTCILELFSALKWATEVGNSEVIIIDSISALLQAGSLSLEDFHLFCEVVRGTETVLIVTNQYRHTLRKSGHQKFLPMYREYMEIISPIGIQLKNRGWIRKAGRIIGHKLEVKVHRNKITGGESVLKGQLIYGIGITELEAR